VSDNTASKILYALSVNPSVLTHSVRIAHTARGMAAKLSLPWPDGYWLAGLAHDLGKLTWPDELHDKIGLTAVDWTLIHAHPVQSADYLRDLMPNLDGLIMDAVLHHHERPDRKGYPEGTEPTVQSLIVAVADCYDALTTSRPYRREPFSRQQALDEVARWAPLALVEALRGVAP
jgi:HD-GYP domain-containing protein (c-di-GMP phosphodiesterase class II)